MAPGRALLAYIVVVFGGAALIAPWVHHALLAVGISVSFRRILTRCLLILALGGLWPLVKAIGIRSLAEIGWKRNSAWLNEIWSGLGFGTVLVFLAGAASIAAGAAYYFPPPDSVLASKVATAAISAVVVAILEETLFRGAIDTALRKTWSSAAALWVGSAIYAIVHFFAKVKDWQFVEWHSGFSMLGEMLSGFTNLEVVLPGFFSLTLLGVILALAFRRTGSLFLSMAIHAALIFWGKMFAVLFDQPESANVWIWGTEKLIDGWFCFGLLFAATIWFARPRNETAV